MPLSDPKAVESYALLISALNDHTEIINLLYHASDVEDVLQWFQQRDKTSKGISYLERLFKTEQDKEFLENNLSIEKENKAKKIGMKKM